MTLKNDDAPNGMNETQTGTWIDTLLTQTCSVSVLRADLARAIPKWPKAAQPFGWNLVSQLLNIERGQCDMERMPALMAWQVEQIKIRLMTPYNSNLASCNR